MVMDAWLHRTKLQIAHKQKTMISGDCINKIGVNCTFATFTSIYPVAFTLYAVPMCGGKMTKVLS